MHAVNPLGAASGVPYGTLNPYTGSLGADVSYVDALVPGYSLTRRVVQDVQGYREYQKAQQKGNPASSGRTKDPMGYGSKKTGGGTQTTRDPGMGPAYYSKLPAPATDDMEQLYVEEPQAQPLSSLLLRGVLLAGAGFLGYKAYKKYKK